MILAERRRLTAVAALILWAGCGESPSTPPASPSARWEIVETLRADRELERHPSDGGGRAWLEATGEEAPSAVAGEPGRWTLVYEAAGQGVAEGGWVFFQAPPFWGWSTPQVSDPGGLGYTEVTTEADGVALEPETVDQQLLAIRVRGGDLRPGERIRIVYGAGPAGARADRFAERRSRFYIAVDGDGDGIRALVPDVLAIDIEPGPAARLVLTLPSTARPGETARLTVAALDRLGNSGVLLSGRIALSCDCRSEELPRELSIDPADGGVKTLTLRPGEEGVYRVRAKGPGGLQGESNPMLVTSEGRRILWGDLHGHSNFSDGTGTPKDYFLYARDVAALDVAALTDHDHWGMEALDEHPELWEEIRQQTGLFHQPGRFVTLLGYEWTSWSQGHRHVLYFEDQGEVLSSIDLEYDTPPELWEALRGRKALTFAHHSAGGPIATNWEFGADPELEPVTEIVSAHGSSEALDSPGVIYSPVPGNFVRDVLGRGLVLGFVGSGDSHDGHPGLAGLASPSGGLAAILGEELTRDAVLAALRSRRVYATNGPRIVLRASLAGREMGSRVALGELQRNEGGEAALEVVAFAPGVIETVELIRKGEPVQGRDCQEQRSCRQTWQLAGLRGGDFVYLRVVQSDGGAAWSSPFFIDP